jgi:hypothetical protein
MEGFCATGAPGPSEAAFDSDEFSPLVFREFQAIFIQTPKESRISHNMRRQ